MLRLVVARVSLFPSLFDFFSSQFGSSKPPCNPNWKWRSFWNGNRNYECFADRFYLFGLSFALQHISFVNFSVVNLRTTLISGDLHKFELSAFCSRIAFGEFKWKQPRARTKRWWIAILRFVYRDRDILMLQFQASADIKMINHRDFFAVLESTTEFCAQSFTESFFFPTEFCLSLLDSRRLNISETSPSGRWMNFRKTGVENILLPTLPKLK